jgi:SAM-dependent methyltransferase
MVTEAEIEEGREAVAFVAGAVLAEVEGGKKVVVGTRTWLGPDWTHVDIDSTDLREWDTNARYPVDIVSEAHQIKMTSGTADLVYSQEMLEHVPRKEYMRVLKEWARLIKPGGYIWIEVPDFLACCEQVLAYDTLEMDRGIQQLFYGGQANEFDFHYNGFTPRIFEDDYNSLGFDVVSIRRGYEAGYLQAIGRKRQ